MKIQGIVQRKCMKFDQKVYQWFMQSCMGFTTFIYNCVSPQVIYKFLCLQLYFDSKVCDCDHAFAKFYAIKAVYQHWLLLLHDLGPFILDLNYWN